MAQRLWIGSIILLDWLQIRMNLEVRLLVSMMRLNTDLGRGPSFGRIRRV